MDRRHPERLTRRRFLGASAALAGVGVAPSPARAAPGLPELRPNVVAGVATFELVVDWTPIVIAGRPTNAITVNGTLPGPLLRFVEGQEVELRVENRLDEDTSIHWHGVLLPPEMDGVPGVSFPGILPHSTFVYRFPLKQYGTYWYHSHSHLQEQLGHLGPILIEPRDGFPYAFDRELTIVLSDWTFANPHRILSRLKKQPGYFNWQRLTLADLLRGAPPSLSDRLMWASMRMDPTDILDVTSATYTHLVNGLAPTEPWTGLFQPGERVLLHIINASAATYYDVRIPGLPLTVVQSNGQFVEPVVVDELRAAVAETWDVLVEPTQDRVFPVFAETMDRSGYALGALAPREGMPVAVPPRRRRPVLTMADMGMAHGDGHDMHAPAPEAAPTDEHAGHATPADEHAGHAMPAAEQVDVAVAGAIRTSGLRAPGTIPEPVPHEADTHGPGNAMVPDIVRSRLHEPGIGLGSDGWRVLTYADLRSLHPEPRRPPDREIELHLTGNMERFMWSIDGVPFAESELIPFEYGERIRLTMVNDTMMNHPMHLHGMWMELENGQGEHIPRVHTVNVQPAERLSVLVTADAPGMWAFHCHILYHMHVGMFRVVLVSEPGEVAPPSEHGPSEHDHHG